MSKNKYVIVGIVFGLIGLAGVAWAVVPSQNTQLVEQKVSNVQGTSTGGLLETSDPNSIPLNRPRQSNLSSGGLSVTNGSSANNLGQLTPDSSNSNKSSSKPQSNPFDPTTFGQYDKYKEETSALFGEVQVGTGDELTAGKKAAVYYKGWLTDGQLFDTTRPDKDGKLQPFVFEMGANQVIPGWEQGLAGMKVGGTRLVIVPPAVGYGPSGQGPIPGNAVLIFQVQLAAVE